MGEDENKTLNPNEDENKTSKPNYVTADSLLNLCYERYDEELNKLLQRSLFVWGFEALLFTGFGWLLVKHIHKLYDKNCYILIILDALCFLGLCVSAIWIALAKSSKTWQEWNEHKIALVERDSKLFPFTWRKYGMGGFTPVFSKIDNHLSSTNNGLFSLGKLNVFVAQFMWSVWAGANLAVSVVAVVLEKNSSCVCHALLLILAEFVLYLVFLFLLKNKCKSSHLSGPATKDRLFDLFLELEKIEKRLNCIKLDLASQDKPNLASKDKEEQINAEAKLKDSIFDVLHILNSAFYDASPNASGPLRDEILHKKDKFQRDYVKGKAEEDENYWKNMADEIQKTIKESKKFIAQEIWDM